MPAPTRPATPLKYTEFPVANGNFDGDRKVVDRIILHTEVGFRAGAEARFNNPQSHVSAHYGINEDGTIDHFLEEYLVAYHAGNYAMNQRSIGIEHEDLNKPFDPRPDILYQASAALVADICKFYNIPCDRTHILKHSEVSDQPTGCPDALDVDRIVRQAQALIGTPAPVPTPQPASSDGTDYDKSQALKILQAWVAINGGNLEGAANHLVQDADAAFKQLNTPQPDGKLPVLVSQSTLVNIGTKAKNLDVIAKYFGDSDIQEQDSGYGQKVVDNIKLFTQKDSMPLFNGVRSNPLSAAVSKLGQLYSDLFIAKES